MRSNPGWMETSRWAQWPPAVRGCCGQARVALGSQQDGQGHWEELPVIVMETLPLWFWRSEFWRLERFSQPFLCTSATALPSQEDQGVSECPLHAGSIVPPGLYQPWNAARKGDFGDTLGSTTTRNSSQRLLSGTG